MTDLIILFFQKDNENLTVFVQKCVTFYRAITKKQTFEIYSASIINYDIKTFG